MRRLFIIFALVLSLLGCAPKKQQAPSTRAFRMPEIPAMLTEPEQRLSYLVSHFWDDYFSGEWASDSSMVRGVKNDELQQNISNYIGLLLSMPVDQAQKQVGQFFHKIEATADTLSYTLLTDLAVQYLYDPNSPMRSEDLYLPFVEGLTRSSYTNPAKLRGYKFELQQCRLNPYGSIVPDFSYKDIHERKHTLYEFQAQFTMLFFSNPGCHACQEIIDQLNTRPYIDTMIADGTLGILNIYIDGETDKWRAYVPNYPANWMNGYDYAQVIHTDQLYYVRAIPSLYLLDADKRVIGKDLPVERALSFLDNIATNYYAN